MHATLPLLKATNFPAISRQQLTSLQVNLGYRCNQSCVHCHVDAGPNRTEMMDDSLIDLIGQVLRARSVEALDLTGGAPELHEGFRRIVREARSCGVRVIDRCNLTILYEPGQEDLAEFLAAEQVEVVASLPCYSLERVDRQRGAGVFDKSIAALQKLNALGYGRAAGGLALNLVYNPQGAVLPPPQGPLEADYKRELRQRFGIEFNHLFTITNMPINRFALHLRKSGQFDAYMDKLLAAFNPQAAAGVMCRSMVSVAHDGTLYDCDFNQMLDMPAAPAGHRAPNLFDFDFTALMQRRIRFGAHCLACTAGAGSSCGGATA